MTRVTMDVPGGHQRGGVQSNGALRRGCCRAALLHAASRTSGRALFLAIAAMTGLTGVAALVAVAVTVIGGA